MKIVNDVVRFPDDASWSGLMVFGTSTPVQTLRLDQTRITLFGGRKRLTKPSTLTLDIVLEPLSLTTVEAPLHPG